MAAELTQNVEILGEVFHVRTRRTDQAGLSVRTEVLLADKVVATRESCFDRRGELEDEVALAWMKEQHRRVLEMFIARALRYPAGGAPAVPCPSSFVPIPSPWAAGPRAAGPRAAGPRADDPAGGPPSAGASRELAGALRVRRFFGSFSTLLGPPSRTPPADVDRRLGEAAEAFEWMTRSSLFEEIRLDEQVRCHLLKDKIDDWLTGERDPEAAGRIWSEVVTFNNYLSEVNHRSELVAFDRGTLDWALGEVKKRGMTEVVLERLAWLHGLLPQLNRLLDHPAGVLDETWIGQLEIALALAGEEEQPRRSRP